jgi:cell division inhibitor SepF
MSKFESIRKFFGGGQEDSGYGREEEYGAPEDGYDEQQEDYYGPGGKKQQPQRGASGSVVNITTPTQLQVVLVKPESFSEGSEVADHLGRRRTVVVNFESTKKEVARRLLDFLSGVVYSYNGKISRVATNTYIVTPYNVGVVGEEFLGELENSGLYQ